MSAAGRPPNQPFVTALRTVVATFSRHYGRPPLQHEAAQLLQISVTTLRRYLQPLRYRDVTGVARVRRQLWGELPPDWERLTEDGRRAPGVTQPGTPDERSGRPDTARFPER